MDDFAKLTTSLTCPWKSSKSTLLWIRSETWFGSVWKDSGAKCLWMRWNDMSFRIRQVTKNPSHHSPRMCVLQVVERWASKAWRRHLQVRRRIQSLWLYSQGDGNVYEQSESRIPVTKNLSHLKVVFRCFQVERICDRMPALRAWTFEAFWRTARVGMRMHAWYLLCRSSGLNGLCPVEVLTHRRAASPTASGCQMPSKFSSLANSTNGKIRHLYLPRRV